MHHDNYAFLTPEQQANLKLRLEEGSRHFVAKFLSEYYMQKKSSSFACQDSTKAIPPAAQ